MEAQIIQYIINGLVTIVITGSSVATLWMKLKANESNCQKELKEVKEEIEVVRKDLADTKELLSTEWPTDFEGFHKEVDRLREVLKLNGMPLTAKEVIIIAKERNRRNHV